MNLEQMTAPEKQALRSLVRMMVGADGSYSAEETATLQKAASELGEEEFWELVNDSGHHHLDEEVLKARAHAVERREAREAIYGILFGVAAAGTVDGEEGRLLDWLAEAWELKTAVESEG